MLVYDSTLRVPLVFSGAAAPKRIVTAPVSLSDVAATLRHAAGLPPDGPSPNLLAPQLAERDIYAETQYPRAAGWHPLAVLAGERWKLIRSSETELYDLPTDPGEQKNVAGDHAGVVQGMTTRLDKDSDKRLQRQPPSPLTRPSVCARLDTSAGRRLERLRRSERPKSREGHRRLGGVRDRARTGQCWASARSAAGAQVSGDSIPRCNGLL